MKGLTKTLVALVLVMTLVATMGISAMAAEYSTKTVYQAEGKISVVAKATDLTAGDIVTYVATTDEENVNENTIVYINQAEADEDGNATFTYTTSVTNIDAAMFFGGSTEASRVAANEEKGYAIEVKINGGDTIETVYALEQDANADEVIRKFEFTAINFAGKIVSGVEFNGEAIEAFAADADTLMVSTDLINADGVLNILTDDDAATFVAPIISEKTAAVNGDLVAFAQAASGSKFGIVLYKNEAPASFAHDVVVEDDYVVLPALGKNVKGIYAVELQGYAEYLGADVNVAAYAFDGANVVVSEAVNVK